jgi:hypothetical protein
VLKDLLDKVDHMQEQRSNVSRGGDSKKEQKRNAMDQRQHNENGENL